MSNFISQTTVAPYRAHVASVICPAYGWDFLQVATTTDTLTKDGEVVTLVWGANKLLSFSSTAGLVVDGQAPCKLQKLTNLLAGSKVMGETPDSIWASLPAGHPAKLGAKAALRAKAAEILVDMLPATSAVDAEIAKLETPAPAKKAPAKKAPASRKAGSKVVAATTLEDMGF
jgi:hypothetical protein